MTDEEKEEKLAQLDQKYDEKLSQLREKAFNLVKEFSQKADESEAAKILQSLKGGHGS